MYKSFSKRFVVTMSGVISSCAMALLAACSVAPRMNDEVPDPPTMGEDLFRRITETDPFENWTRFPDAQGILVSNPPHGPMSEVFINDVVEAALGDFTGALPADAIIVKRNIGEDPQITEAKLTVMWKVPDFDPDNNDWFWANISPDGEIAAEGKVAGCMGCHGGARANDFVFVHQF